MGGSSVFFLFACVGIVGIVGHETIFLYGQIDNSYAEFSTKVANDWIPLYPSSFSGGFSVNPQNAITKDVFPGFQAGPSDLWANSQQYPLLLSFTISSSIWNVVSSSFAFSAAVLGVSTGTGGTVAVYVNSEKAAQQSYARGSNEDILNTFSGSVVMYLSFTLDKSLFVLGSNTIELVISLGAWNIYDYLLLEGLVGDNIEVLYLSAKSLPFLANVGGVAESVVQFSGTAVGTSEVCTLASVILSGDTYTTKSNITGGTFTINVNVPEQSQPNSVLVTLTDCDSNMLFPSFSATVEPVRHLTVMLIPHSHLDIGYADLQPNVIISQKTYLEHALSLIEETTSSPSPMTWVAEASWPEWLLMNDFGPYDEYGAALSEATLTKDLPTQFWVDIPYMKNVAGYAALTTSAHCDDDRENNRRLVDGSRMEWSSYASASSSWAELSFDTPLTQLKYIAIRGGDVTVNSVTVSINSGQANYTVATLPDHTARALLSFTTFPSPISNIRLDTFKTFGDIQFDLTELEVWVPFSPQDTRTSLESAFQSGRCDSSALLMNFLTGCPPTEWMIRQLIRSISALSELGKTTPTTALITDVPGFSWVVPDILSEAGVKYFYPALNLYHANNGLYNMPQAFWWEGPSGGRVLVFHSFDNYNEGWEMGWTRSVELVEENAPSWLESLDAEEYSFTVAALRTLGDITDDGPVAMYLPDVVSEWNEKWLWPHAVIATPTEFFDVLTSDEATKYLPVLQGDWTGYWEDGVGSSAQETLLAREVHHSLLLSLAFGAIQQELDLTKNTTQWDSLMLWAEEGLHLYYEHTWGADISTSQPYDPYTTDQWLFKSQPLYNSVAYCAQLSPLLTPLAIEFSPVTTPSRTTLAVLNPSGFDKSGIVQISWLNCDPSCTVFTSPGSSTVTPSFTTTVDGEEVLNFWADNVPSVGISYFEVETSSAKKLYTEKVVTEQSYDTLYYTLKVESNGKISSIFDKQLQQEIVESSVYSMNQFIYVPGTDNSDQRTFSSAVITQTENDIYVEVTISSQLSPWFSSVVQKIRLYKTTKLIEFENTMEKLDTISKEALYFAFPFNVDGGEMRLEMTGGVMSVERDQLSGACRDWMAIQDSIGVVSSPFSVLLSSPDTPLFVIGKINVLTWQTELDISNTTLFAYTENNYWDTNYKASQGGVITFRYAITSMSGRATDTDIVTFGQSYALPMLGLTLPKISTSTSTDSSISFLSVVYSSATTTLYPHARILSVLPSDSTDNGFLVRIQETIGTDAMVYLNLSQTAFGKGYPSAQQVDLLEKNGVSLSVSTDQKTGNYLVKLWLGPYSLSTILISFPK
ncbi:glycosyl hydrolase family 38 [Pelomyxa schiedti]|nr:glycosyl hydrolase family 38 [Pelomyxa schiedti]